jgi:hypothetical protein
VVLVEVEVTVVVVIPVGMCRQLHADETTAEAVYFPKQDGFFCGGFFLSRLTIFDPPPGLPQVGVTVTVDVEVCVTVAWAPALAVVVLYFVNIED